MNLRALDDDLETWFYLFAKKLHKNHKGFSSKTMDSILEFSKVHEKQLIEFIENKNTLSVLTAKDWLTGE